MSISRLDCSLPAIDLSIAVDSCWQKDVHKVQENCSRMKARAVFVWSGQLRVVQGYMYLKTLAFSLFLV